MNGRRFIIAFVLLGAGCSDRNSQDLMTSSAEGLSSAAQEKIADVPPAPGHHLGRSVAMAGNTILLGSARGYALVYARSVTGWTRQGTLLPPGNDQRAGLGRSVALEGDTAVVGADLATGVGTDNSGAVYVFQRLESRWAQSQLLVPENGSANSGFGAAVALQGDTLVVGGHASAFVFTRTNGVWGARQKLAAPDDATSFGQAVAVSRDSILVGSPSLDSEIGSPAPAGAAYLFTRSGDSFTLSATITSSDAAPGSRFGQAVALSGTTALVGADQANGAPAKRGVVYSFVRSGSAFVADGKLQASDGLPQEQFGLSVALLGDIALIGAPYHTHRGQNGNHGSAYLFMRSNGTWSEKEELRAFDYQNNDYFGSAVTLSGASALVGSPNDDFSTGQAAGSTYVFALRSEMGEACGAGSQCPSGFCSDGRCCDTACSGACDACSVATGAQRDGQCGLLSAGAQGSPSCAPGTCSGISDSCPATSACTTCQADTDCGENEFCGYSLVCVPRKGQGHTCEPTASGDCHSDGCRVCASGHCVDGVCCNSECEGDCVACQELLTGTDDGVCAALSTRADPEHACEPNAGSGFTQVSVGYQFACGLRDSRIVCAGRNDSGQADPPTGTFTFITTGNAFGCGIRTGGQVACWGSPVAGQVNPPLVIATGLSARFDRRCLIVSNGPPQCWGIFEPPTTSETLLSVSNGWRHSCGLRPDGSIACWGTNFGGEGSPDPGAYRSVVAGSDSTCALRADNTVACWGDLQRNAQTPAGTFRAIDIAFHYGCGIRSDDTLTCWGSPPDTNTPSGSYKSLSTGPTYACAIRTDDQLVCWGVGPFDLLNLP